MPITPIKQKSSLDKFYTKPSVAESCLGSLYPFVKTFDYFIEPSAGSGVFLDCLKYKNKIGYDISPTRSDIYYRDWLYCNPGKYGAVIYGNPPFGKRGSLASSFIKHAIQYAKVIAFVLPLTFRKEGKQKAFPPNWKLLSDITLPENSFTLDGEDYHVPCCFQVWGMDIHFRDNDDLRASNQIKLATSDFEFVDKDQATHFVFGAAPNRVIPKEAVKPSNRGYYLRAMGDNVIERLRSIDWKTHALSSVKGGVAWFTKQQLVDIYVSKSLDIGSTSK